MIHVICFGANTKEWAIELLKKMSNRLGVSLPSFQVASYDGVLKASAKMGAPMAVIYDGFVDAGRIEGSVRTYKAYVAERDKTPTYIFVTKDINMHDLLPRTESWLII